LREDARGGEEFWVEAFEEGDEWLYAERKAVEDAGDDEAAEGESERVAEEGEPEFAERSARAHGDEEIETEDGGRRREEERRRLRLEILAEFGKGEPVGERRRENEKIAVTRKARRKERRSSVMALGVDSSGNGMAEGFGFGETVFFEDGLSRRRFDVCEESNGGVFVGGSFQDDEDWRSGAYCSCGISQERPNRQSGNGRRNRHADCRVAIESELAATLGKFRKNNTLRFSNLSSS